MISVEIQNLFQIPDRAVHYLTFEMVVIAIITWFLALCYLCLLGFYRYGWHLSKKKKLSNNPIDHPFVSVIIVARNEEENIERCLESVCSQDYPDNRYEVWLVDDHSEDRTLEITERFKKVKLLSLSNDTDSFTISHKKEAIKTAISRSQGEIILNTDADCVVKNTWISSMAGYFAEFPNTQIVAGPVRMNSISTGGWWASCFSAFQIIDFSMYQGLTAAGIATGIHHLANGANLAYRKSAFISVGGFSGYEHLPTGDDMMLAQKIVGKYKNSAQYASDQHAIVATQPAPSFKRFINQRIRWASKSADYSEKSILPVMGIVFLFNLMLIVLVVAASVHPLSYHIWGMPLVVHFLILIAIKTGAEGILLFPVLSFLNQLNVSGWLIVLQPFHICYTVSAAFLGLKGNYEWKGRKFYKSNSRQ